MEDGGIKIADYNSNLATLMRIDSLIRHRHELILGMYSNNKELPLKVLDRIYVEGQTKFTDPEKTKCKGFQKQIAELKQKWGMNLYQPLLGYEKKQNQYYIQGWNEIGYVEREYDIYLMQTMEKHGMLLQDKKISSIQSM